MASVSGTKRRAESNLDSYPRKRRNDDEARHHKDHRSFEPPRKAPRSPTRHHNSDQSASSTKDSRHKGPRDNRNESSDKTGRHKGSGDVKSESNDKASRHKGPSDVKSDSNDKPKADEQRSDPAKAKRIGGYGSDVEVADMSELQRVMGFTTFKTTKNTRVWGNKYAYGKATEKKVEYRQYMNRTGGFNRPLSPSR